MNSLLLALTQFLIFELGEDCNLRRSHGLCPSGHAGRWEIHRDDTILDDQMIERCAVDAYRQRGFTGTIGWHYYNEPTLQCQRMFALMQRIRRAVPESRFILWTNGTRMDELLSGPADLFEMACISDYDGRLSRWIPDLQARGVRVRMITGFFDGRLDNQGVCPTGPCARPNAEFILDARGRHHICCFDWRGAGSLGNVFIDGWETLLQRWQGLQGMVNGWGMSLEAPAVCRTCRNRKPELWRHDAEICRRIDGMA